MTELNRLRARAKAEIAAQRELLLALRNSETAKVIRWAERLKKKHNLCLHTTLSSSGFVNLSFDVSNLDGFRDKRLCRVLADVEATYPFTSSEDQPDARWRIFNHKSARVVLTLYAQLKANPAACRVIETEVTETVKRIKRTFDCSEIKQEVVNARS